MRRELIDTCNERVSDSLVIGVILEGVNKSFQDVVTALRVQETLQLDVVERKLVAAEARMDAQNDEATALAIQGSQKYRKDTRRCFFCGEVGHIKRDCKKRMAAEKGTDNDEGKAMVVSGHCLALAEMRSAERGEVLLDTAP